MMYGNMNNKFEVVSAMLTKFQVFSYKLPWLLLATKISEELSVIIFNVQQFPDPEDGGIISSKNLILEIVTGSVALYLILSHAIAIWMLNSLKTKRRLLYLKTQSVPRCKHFSSRL